MSDRSKITSRATALKAAGLVMVGILAFGTNAVAEGDPPPTEPTPDTAVAPEPVVATSSSVSLTLFGAPLVVDINLDPGGNLVDVALNPTGDFTATKVKPNNVVFVNEVEGVSVKVRAKHGGERIEARATDLDDVSGANQWSGDVFENGQATVVDFTVGAREDGSPDITGVSVTSPLEFTVGDTEYKTGGGEHDGERAAASVAIRFADSGQSRTLRINVSLRTGDEHTSAKLSIGLSRIKGAEVPDGEAVGPHTWTGMLCDGTTATVSYTVAEDGSITITASPEGAEVASGDRRVSVRFATGERIKIKVGERDGQLRVAVGDRVRCDAADPAVNTPIDPDADTGDDGDHRRDGHRGGGWRGGDEGRGNHRRDRGGD